MIEVRLHKEITEYREKIIGRLSFRQLLAILFALFAGITTYFLAQKFLPWGADYLTILVVTPIFAIEFVKINGFSFLFYLKLMMRHRLANHRKPYRIEFNDQLERKW